MLRLLLAYCVLEIGSGLLGSDLGHYGSETTLTPPSISRSVTASPGRGSLTPEQRELKRQQDHARRDSKLHARSQRTCSNSSSVYSLPVTLAGLTTGGSSMSIYTTVPATVRAPNDTVLAFIHASTFGPQPKQHVFPLPTIIIYDRTTTVPTSMTLLNCYIVVIGSVQAIRQSDSGTQQYKTCFCCHFWL
ncbi:hypothetical protein V8F06_013611 [Rhypophila decipiens]